MGGKKGESKKERAAAAASEKEAAQAAAQEDAAWEAAGDGKRGKGAQKQQDAADKSAAAARRKAEAKALEEAEAAMMAKKPKGKAARPASGKVTAAQIAATKAQQAKESEATAAAQAKANRREVSGEEYERLVDTENTNRNDDVIEARSVEAALSALSTDEPAADPHPEKRRKAAYKDFYERELPIMKEELPGLKLGQYKDKIFAKWMKSPENPANQPK